MTGIYILGLASVFFLASLNIWDEVRARRAQKKTSKQQQALAAPETSKRLALLQNAKLQS
jgi:hypothetical protein